MKVSISLRLFFAVLLTALAVAATGLWMLRDSVQRGFARYVTEIELKQLEPLAQALEKEYARQGHWPGKDEASHWLSQQVERLRGSPGAGASGLFGEPRRTGPAPGPDAPPAPSGTPPPPLPEFASAPYPDRAPPPRFLGAPKDDRPPGPPPDRFSLRDRIGLTDATGQVLAGLPPSPEALRRALEVNGKTVGHLTLATAASPSDAIAQAFLLAQRRQLLLIALVCIGLSGLSAAMLAAHFRKPIRQLVNATAQLTRGHFGTRIDSARSDELGTLAEAVNHLAIMLEQHEASRRQWVADTSHELRTPVAVLLAQIESLLDGVRQPSPAQFAAMQRQIAVLGKLIEELHQLSRADVGQLKHQMTLLNPWDIVVAEAESFRDRFANAGLRLHVEPPLQSPQVMADASRLQQVIANLLENSLRYTDVGGEVRITSTLQNRRWLLYIDDSPPGVPDEALAQLGTRFFRVERSRNRALGGSGLGLALCQRIMAAHGGQMQFSHSPLGGLRITLAWPLPSREKNP